MKVLVTGGSGFIGSALCRYLIGRTDHEVVNLDKLTYAGTRGSTAMLDGDQRYTFVRADICDAKAVAEVFAERRPDAVVNLAAETHVDRSITGSGSFIETNVLGVHTLLESALQYWSGLEGQAKGRFRFLQVSTDEVYGSLSAEGLFTEESRYDPSSPYSASKAAGDHLVRAWRRTYGLPALISVGSNTFGPYQLPEKLIPLMILNALEGLPLPVYGDGSQVRDWMFVDDHARALALILGHGRPGETYNVGARNERRNLEVVGVICDLLDNLAGPLDRPRRDLITFVADRPGHDARYGVDPAKLEADLGWRPDASFDEHLRATVLWHLDNRDWWEPLRAYANERQGLSPKGPAP